MEAEQAGVMVFGGFDGLTSAIGVVAAGLAVGGAITRPAGGLAAAAAVSMAGGEFLSDSDSGLAAAAIMGVATLIGSFLPAAPYLMFGRPAATVVSLIVTTLAVIVIAEVKRRTQDVGKRKPGVLIYAQTVGLLVIAAGAAVLVAVAIGAGG